MVSGAVKKFINVIFVTSLVALAIAYVTSTVNFLPELNFLESIGVYTLIIHVSSFLNDLLNKTVG